MVTRLRALGPSAQRPTVPFSYDLRDGKAELRYRRGCDGGGGIDGCRSCAAAAALRRPVLVRDRTLSLAHAPVALHVSAVAAAGLRARQGRERTG